MSDVFIKVLNMSIAAGWLILVVIVLRLLLKKAPKWIRCVLWGLVAFRLICPVSIESSLSLQPSAEPISKDIAYAKYPAIDSGVSVINDIVNPVLADSFTPDPVASVNPLQIRLWFAAYIWLIGIAIMLAYAGISYLQIHRRVRTSILLYENIMICDEIQTPFILGVLRPRIFLPSDMPDVQVESVLAHEKAHIRRHDHWWKPLGFLLLSIYWFQPLCWIAYILLCRDIELACDESVVKVFDMEEKKAYSKALLSCSIPRKIIAACPLAFGENGVKERIKSILQYKKAALVVVVFAVMVCIVVGVCFLTNPEKNEVSLAEENPNTANEILKGEDIEVHTLPETNDEEATMYDRIPMVMVDGRLYYDTGRINETVHSDSKDGEITSTVDASHIPEENNQSNFGEGYPYQYGENDTIEIYINEKWAVFEYREGNGEMSLPEENSGMFSESSEAEVSEVITFRGKIVDHTIEFKYPTIVVEVTDGTLKYDRVCFRLPEGKEEWMVRIDEEVEIACADDFEGTEPVISGKLSDIRSIEEDESNRVLDSGMSNGEPSMAYVESLQDSITQAMMDGELPFVVSSAVMENPNRLVVTVAYDMDSPENITKIKAFETMGEAIEIKVGDVQNILEDFPVEKAFTKKAEEICGKLDALEFRTETCDGLQEFTLTGEDGTKFNINLNEGWVWRNGKEEADLTEELIREIQEILIMK